MINTLTLNPAIDLFINTPQMEAGRVNRTTDSDVQANGKGVNVSFILQRLGIANTALGIGGGFTLAYITQQLQAAGIPTDFIDGGGITRINVFTHVQTSGQEYKLVNPGPEVAPEAVVQLLEKLRQLSKGDQLIVSGSFARGVAPQLVVIIGQIAAEHDIDLILDTSYRDVLDALPYHPLLIKPNNAELASWYDLPADIDANRLVALGRDLQQRGAQNVLISRGNDGAIFLGKHVYSGNAPDVAVLNTAGAGDTMLATFAAGMVQGKDDATNLQYALAAGSDTASKPWITDFNNLDRLVANTHVIQLDQ